jgi:hypothetical protein
MITPPRFSTGNKSILKALNEIVAWARKIGVNPAGRPGWAQSVDGWIPPVIDASSSSFRFWDIEIVSKDDRTIKIKVPAKIKKYEGLDSTCILDVADDTENFTADVGKYLVIEVTKDIVATMKIAPDYTDFPWPWETETLDDERLSMLNAFIPLYKFIAPPETLVDGVHLRINDSIVAVRLAPDAHLELIDTMMEHPDGQILKVIKAVPGFGAE